MIREKRLAPRADPARTELARIPTVIRYGRHRPRRAASPTTATRPALRLEDAADGAVVEVPGVGRAYVIESREEIGVDVDPGLLFFDIEAGGFTAAPLFLIGVMRATGRTVTVTQLLARTYAEEAAVVTRFLEEATGAETLVSYNGKSYDLPFIRTRAAHHRLAFDVDLPHLDLVHPARRRWKDELDDCRLQTLETRILGKPRLPDIPGRDIPDAYHAFVRTGDASDMAKILVHNRRDLVSLAELLPLLNEDGLNGAGS